MIDTLVNTKIVVSTPSVPNFIRVTFANGESLWAALSNFTDEQLNILADNWKVALFKNRDRQREEVTKDKEARAHEGDQG